MTRDDYEALALRVEREEPSAELGIAVAAAACGKGLSHFGTDDDAVYINPMRYLRSRDAAASLCPDGWIVADLSQTVGLWHCSIWREDERMEFGRAPTEPRARTAAALRARGMEAKDE